MPNGRSSEEVLQEERYGLVRVRKETRRKALKRMCNVQVR